MYDYYTDTSMSDLDKPVFHLCQILKIPLDIRKCLVKNSIPSVVTSEKSVLRHKTQLINMRVESENHVRI